MAGTIISGVIYGFCALFAIGTGIFQIKSEHPIAFYTGEKAPAEDEISDVKLWNRKHGMMWIIYGIIIALSWLCGLMLGDNIVSIIPCIGGVLLPLIFMVWYHHRLVKQYKINSH